VEAVVAAVLHLAALHQRRVHRAMVHGGHHEALLHQLPGPAAGRGAEVHRRRPGSKERPAANSIIASASFRVEREGEDAGMRRRGIPIGHAELLPTRESPT
jgi:hypothetical protein